jgi:transposase
MWLVVLKTVAMVTTSVDERLFEVGEPAETAAGPPGAPVDKTFRPYDMDQVWLLPPSLVDWLPEGHLARLVDDLVEHTLDLSEILASYTEERGAPPYDPRLLLKLLIYGYATGVCSSRKIEQRCHDDVAFRFLAANATPDYRSIARFRRRHLHAIRGLFVQVLATCRRAGLVKLGRVALDGTKVRANASRHKAMSHERMTRREAQLAAEDARHGRDRGGEELPGELARRRSRLAKIRAAKESLERDAREAAAERAARRVAERAERAVQAGGEVDPVVVDAQAHSAAEAAAAAAQPKPTAQRNFTDPESRIVKTADGSFQQGYNAQVIVDDTHQVIVAAELTNQAADAPHLPDLLDQVQANLGALPRQLLADAGYCSQDNLRAATDRAVDALIATGRMGHHQSPPTAPRGRIPNDATPRQRMARKLRTTKGRAAYARRKVIVEPVFGQMQTRQGADRLLLRGQAAAKAEHLLHCLCHNILKLLTSGQPLPATAS